MLYFMLFVFWTAAGAALFVWQAWHPEDRRLTVLQTDISFGWFAFVLALYNLARWYSSRASIQARRADEAARLQRSRRLRNTPEETS